MIPSEDVHIVHSNVLVDALAFSRLEVKKKFIFPSTIGLNKKNIK